VLARGDQIFLKEARSGIVESERSQERGEQEWPAGIDCILSRNNEALEKKVHSKILRRGRKK